MKKRELLSLRKYAEHRGVRLSAVQKAIKAGRIATEKNGKIDPEICDLAWDAATDPSKQRKKISPRRVQKHAELFAEARASSEDYKSKLSQLKFEQQLGRLVDAETVRKRAFESARSMREALLNLPNQIGVELAAETDPIKVINLLEREITACLEGLAAPRIEAAQAGLTPLGSDPAAPGPEVVEDEDEDDGELELDGKPVEAPR